MIEQGIQQKKLPNFLTFTLFKLKPTMDYLHIIDQNHLASVSTNEQLTLTDIFHQFDTITLRGRTSIDRYLNTQHTNEHNQYSQIENKQMNMMIDHRNISLNNQIVLDSSRILSIPQVLGQPEIDINSKGND